MTEPPRAAGGRRAEGWARNAFAVGCSGGRRDRGPLAEAGRKPCGLVGALERERGGVAGAGVRPRSSPFPALRRA